MEADRLALELARRLGPLMPDGIQVRTEGSKLVVASSDGTSSKTDLDLILDQPGEPFDRMMKAIEGALSNVQDFVVETIKGVWPAPSDPSWVGSDPIPTLQVIRVGDQIRIFFGRQDSPVTELDPLSDSDL